MASDSMMLSHIEHSNIPHTEKSAIRRWYDKVHSGGHLARAKKHVAAGGNTIRQGGEALMVGGILGAVSAKLPNGLDANVRGKSVPIDAIVAVAGLGLGVVAAHEEFGQDLTNAGATAMAIFAFRKTEKLVKDKLAQKGAAPAKQLAAKVGKVAGEYGADYGEDPIVAAARKL
jgi:hypothetical protein